MKRTAMVGVVSPLAALSVHGAEMAKGHRVRAGGDPER